MTMGFGWRFGMCRGGQQWSAGMDRRCRVGGLRSCKLGGRWNARRAYRLRVR